MDKLLRTTRAPTCPYIGMMDDAEAFYAYPSSGNRCYRCRVPAMPLTSHQECYCLSGAQNDCPIYLQAVDGTFPPEMSARESPRAARLSSTGILFSLVFILVLTGFLGYRFSPPVRALMSRMLAPVGWKQAGSPTTVAPTPSLFPSATMYRMAAPGCESAVYMGPPCTPRLPTAMLVPSATPATNAAATQACRYSRIRGTPCPP